MIPSISPYPGAKNRNAESYISYILEKGITTYIEPYGGMFGMGLQKPRYPVEIYNDKNPGLALLMRTLSNKDTGLQLLKKMASLEYSGDVFNHAKAKSEKLDLLNESDVQKAAYVWTTLLLSYNGQMKKFKGIHTGKEGITLHNRIIHKLNLLDKLNGLQVLNIDALELIRKYGNDESVFMFIDPPYPKINQTSAKERKKIYAYDMLDDEEQKAFLGTLKDTKAKILVCSYKNDLYDSILCDEFGWDCIHVKDTYKYMSRRTACGHKSRASEFIYINYYDIWRKQ
ncbi:MAG: DNA adenine methylase [Clostridia bacterium]